MIDEASKILLKHLDKEVETLTHWMDGQRALSKEELKHSVTIILNLLQGVGSQLPFWEGQIIQHQSSKVRSWWFYQKMK